ncbi:MAG: flagellar motor switch protein FliM [Planctomycetes bacterium]|nr:flagellar motor switch protein FliM [Planctomycetota bacterium]
MSEVLDQAEIDALLNSVARDAAAAEESPTRAQSAVTAVTATVSQPKVGVYDFKRPERVSKDHIRALGAIHDGFARNFGATLSGFLRTIIDVRVVGVEQLTYSEFIHSLPNPTCFAIVQAPPLEGQMCLEISPLIVYPIIDRLLGGSSTDMHIPQRPLTSIEWRLITRLIERALAHLSEVWHNLVDVRFQMVETESNPQLVHIVAPTEVVVFITFEIKMGQCAGTMSMCIPFNVIESVLAKLTTQSWFGYKPKGASDMQQRRLLRNLVKSKVGLAAFLGETTVKLSELRTLQRGDLIQLDKRAGADLIVQIEGTNKFAGRVGQLRGRRAIRLGRHATIDERL